MNTQLTVLLVDDDRDLLEIYSLTLEELGFMVITARDGQEALARALALQPNLIITDVNMPRMNGLELCQRLRADEQLRYTPLIIHSSDHNVFVPRNEVFLRKSGDLERFKAQVAIILGGGHDGPALASVA